MKKKKCCFIKKITNNNLKFQNQVFNNLLRLELAQLKDNFLIPKTPEITTFHWIYQSMVLKIQDIHFTPQIVILHIKCHMLFLLFLKEGTSLPKKLLDEFFFYKIKKFLYILLTGKQNGCLALVKEDPNWQIQHKLVDFQW